MTSYSKILKLSEIVWNRSEMISIDVVSLPNKFWIDNSSIPAIIDTLRAVSWAMRKMCHLRREYGWVLKNRLVMAGND